jgi:hypothetical protein
MSTRAVKKGFALVGGAAMLVLAVACGGGAVNTAGTPATSSATSSAQTQAPGTQTNPLSPGGGGG